MIEGFEMNRISYRNTLEALPTIGIIVYIMLYWFASTLYPGGNQHDLNAIGFDWMHNYWCNLMNETAMNGVPNPARPYAISAMTLLCASFTLFFIQFANRMVKSRFWKLAIQIFGVLSMVSANLIFTEHHDLMTTLSSVFGVFVVIGVIREIYRSNLSVFKLTGLFNIGLLAINNCIYYTEQGLEYLPMIQKITFVFVLLWIVGLNVKLISSRAIFGNV